MVTVVIKAVMNAMGQVNGYDPWIKLGITGRGWVGGSGGGARGVWGR